MSDLISREATKLILTMKPYDWSNITERREMLNEIDNLPSIEPERKGKWIRRHGADCWECSECHAVLENEDLGMHNYYFCYHCGANMMNKSGYMDIEEVHYG